MGLNDAYSPARSNILMINPLPSASVAYFLIMRDKKQKEVAIQSYFLANSASYFVTNHKLAETNDSRGKRNNLICSRCKKPGYTVDKCFRIIGFTPDFKFTRSKKSTRNVRSNAIVVLREGDDEPMQENSLGINQLSKEQFPQLI